MKSSVKKYAVIGVLCWVVSTFLLILSSQNSEFGIETVGKYVIGIVGIVFFLVAFICMYKSITVWVETDKEAKIEENDERNQQIRGKVAEDVNVFSSVVFAIVMMILLMNNQILGVILIAIANFLINLFQTFRFKKYNDEL